jgi:2,4-dienoyl-CoA reductase (NADPH2)
MRLPVEVVARVRAAVGPISSSSTASPDRPVPDGSTWAEVVQLAKAIEAAGASILNTGIGWHEARVPTIATSVPRRAFTWLTKNGCAPRWGSPSSPRTASTRPRWPKDVLAEGCADMGQHGAPPSWPIPISWPRPHGRPRREIAPCIACNQACLDHTFSGKLTSCLVNPRACHETELDYPPAATPKTVAVVGAGPAGHDGGIIAARRGHRVTLFDRASIGGQLNLAKQVPGKEEFHGLVDWFAAMLAVEGVDLRLNTEARPDDLRALTRSSSPPASPRATPRSHQEPGAQCAGLYRRAAGAPVGKRVVVVGAGGIGFDVAEYLVHQGTSPTEDLDRGCANGAWPTRRRRAAAWPRRARSPIPAARQVTLLQRKAGKARPRAGQDHRLDPPRQPADERRRDARRHDLSPHHRRRAGGGYPPRPGADRCRYRRAVHRAGTRARPCRRADRRRHRLPCHRRRRRGSGT